MAKVAGFCVRLALFTSLVWSPALVADELSDFHELVADAYAPYRSAMFYLRTGNPGVAALELDAARKGWKAVVVRFAKTPPDAFADDDAFAKTVTAIEGAFDDGLAALDGAKLEAASEALAPIRTTLADLRQRNGLRVFGDCIDDMNAAMDRLWVYRHEVPAFDQPAEVNAVKREAAITEFLYWRCHDTAPDNVTSNAEFKRLFEGSLQSLPLIFDALDQGNEGRLINILRELRSFDRMIWLHFG